MSVEMLHNYMELVTEKMSQMENIASVYDYHRKVTKQLKEEFHFQKEVMCLSENHSQIRYLKVYLRLMEGLDKLLAPHVEKERWHWKCYTYLEFPPNDHYAFHYKLFIEPGQAEPTKPEITVTWEELVLENCWE